MELPQAGVDLWVIALWLGHESIQTTQTYLHAHIALKTAALARLQPHDVRPKLNSAGGTYRERRAVNI